MPWPFRRRPQDATSSSPDAPANPPVTIDDLGGRRRLTVHAGGWQTLEPLTPSTTGAAAPVVGSSASFIAGLAGTRPLLPTSSLREVSEDAPRGVTHGLASPLPSDTVAPLATDGGAGSEPVSAEPYAEQEPTRRPVVASGLPAHADLTTYTGELTPAEVEPDFFDDEDYFDDEIAEELPPPIFSTLLAERTGRDLAELRPDLAGREEDGGADAMGDADEMHPARKRSLAESRRLGLGPPIPAGPFDVGNRERVEHEFVIEAPVPEPAPPPPSPEPPRRAVAHYRRAEVPPGVRRDVTRALGRDPGAVRIRRDREVSDIASRIGARAFTRQGEVFLPMEAGPLDAPETRAVLAHELTHVVQHRVYGSSLPRPSSAEGQRLEAEAHAVERFVRGDDPVPRVAPLRTLRATPGDPRVDSGGFTRAVTEQLVARGEARWDADGALVFRPPPGASDEWRASSDASTNEAFRNALQQDQRATTEYGVSRGNTQAPERDRTENERHLRFVHDWQGQLNESGSAGASDAQASLRYEQTRSGAPNATTDSAEFERHLHYVASQSGGEGDEEIVIEQGGFGTALGMTAGLFDRYDRTQEIIAADNERRRVMAAHEATHAATPAPGGQGAPQTTATPTVPAGTVSPTATTTTPTPTTGTPTPRGGTEAHWEDDEDIRLPDPDRPGADTGWGAALGLMAPILSRYDADYTHDSHWGQHEVPATPATPATTPTAATPTTPAGGAAVSSSAGRGRVDRGCGGDRGRGHGGDASRPRGHGDETAGAVDRRHRSHRRHRSPRRSGPRRPRHDAVRTAADAIAPRSHRRP